MLFIVDGTGPLANAEYARAMRDSFCSRLHREVGGSHYWRGPDLFGGTTTQVILALARRRVEERQYCSVEGVGDPLFLCGYSRGGAIAIEIVRQLAPRPVRALFLFDPVDRDHSLDAARIPANVAAVHYARRDPAFGERYGAEARIAAVELAGEMGLAGGNPFSPRVAAAGYRAASAALHDLGFRFDSRNRMATIPFVGDLSVFGNCGLIREGGGANDRRALFHGSHGALGGVPWMDGDAAVVAKVRNWMWEGFRAEGVVGTVLPEGRNRAGG